ncbi:MAG: aminopeptidase [Candidatus Eremiobacteraeota bacterium]|nr:aminopeptidase [Candidatus Eremiobacteraeota bacterium]
MLDINYKQVAKTIINDSMKLNEDDVVWILAGDHNLPLCEEIGIQTWKIGAFPIIEMQSDNLMKRMYKETPDKYLKKPHTGLANIRKHITAFIYMEPLKDPTTLESVPAYKKIAYMTSAMPAKKVLWNGDVKVSLFLYPTPEMAKAYNVSWEFYHDRVWGAIQISPDELYRASKPIKDFLTGKKNIHITSPKGTDLRFSIENRGILLCTGEDLDENRELGDANLNIPAGEAFTSIVEDSTNGVAVFDKVFVDGTCVDDLRLEFKDGSAISFDAASNKDKFGEFFNSLKPKDKIAAEFGIGTNPAVKGVIGCLHTDEKIAGTIHIAIGSNLMYGGKNETPLHFDMIMPGPTVVADGETMMNAGRLTING